MKQSQERMKGKTIEVPEKVNLLNLSRILNVELNKLLGIAMAYSEEIGLTVVDEFQPLRNDLIELLWLEYDIFPSILENPRKTVYKRPPIVTIMGHVDHGKTTLLDAFRDSNLVDQEYGSITQTTAAFSFETESGHYITFIDTPGHEVFDGMRLRGAKATDMVILVISAIEGVQKQTLGKLSNNLILTIHIEVLDLWKKFDLPMVIAINKWDRDLADPDTLILDLAEENEIEVDEIGGEIPSAQISALNKINLVELEEKVIELAEELDLKEEHDCNAECLIVESNLDEESSQITASVVVRKGVLSVGDSFVCGVTEGKVKFILEDKGKIS